MLATGVCVEKGVLVLEFFLEVEYGCLPAASLLFWVWDPMLDIFQFLFLE